MKILHINKFFDLRGGVEVYLHRLMERQAAAGHEVHVLSTRSAENLPSEDRAYFVHRYDFSRSEGWKRDAPKAAAFIWNREAKQATTRMLNDIKPDVVHLHNVYHHLSSSILSAIRASKTPCVQTLHDLKLACPNYSMFTEGAICERCKGGKYWNPILHHCLAGGTMPNVLAAFEMTMTKVAKSYEKTVRTFIAPSAFNRDKMVEWGEPASKFVVIPNPAEVPDRPAEGGGGYVLYAGRLSVEKGVETLIRASARVPSLPLSIAGTGPEEEKMRHLARSLGAAHIRFLGFVHPDELTGIRRRSEALLLPSISYENSPLTILEAMGDGIPVLGAGHAGIVELIEDGVNGLLAVPGNVDAWVAGLQQVLALSPDEKRAMGENGRKRIRERHNWEDHLARLEEAYRK